MDDRVYSLLKVEIGCRLREGASGFKLKEVAEAVGVQLKPIQAHELFNHLCDGIEAEGLAVVEHKSSRESNFADVVKLTQLGLDPDAWES
jgi:hypothetical protein